MSAELKVVPSEDLFSGIKAQAPDALLAVMNECRADPRAHKVDLTVGMYRNAQGITPVMRAVKSAERWLLEHQDSKGYLGPEGDLTYVGLLKPFFLRGDLGADPRVTGIQTPGGTGAIRLAGDIIQASGRECTVWLGVPTWGNYRSLFAASRLKVETYQSFDVVSQRSQFEEVQTALGKAKRGDVIVLQASCTNPTGATFTKAQWETIAGTLSARGLIPLLDVAYQGLGDGFEADVASVHMVLAKVDEALIAYSCDKNFGVYRERVGALYAITKTSAVAQSVYSNMVSLARSNWSMPSDHGAAVVRLILESKELSKDWMAELNEMRERVQSNRQRLAASHSRFAAVAGQQGMFSMLHLDPAAIAKLKAEHAVYMAGTGRINIAGFRGDDIERFVAAVNAVS
ncbi:MAG: aromatic amino acid transaminase [Micropepsaceae bacterium]